MILIEKAGDQRIKIERGIEKQEKTMAGTLGKIQINAAEIKSTVGEIKRAAVAIVNEQKHVASNILSPNHSKTIFSQRLSSTSHVNILTQNDNFLKFTAILSNQKDHFMKIN